MDVREVLTQLEVDIEQTLRRFSNNELLYARFLKKFPNEKTFGELKDAVLQSDYVKIEQSAHTLKGVAANMGFSALTQYCADVVADVREKGYGNIEKHFSELEKEYEKIITVISRIND